MIEKIKVETLKVDNKPNKEISMYFGCYLQNIISR